MSARVPQNTRKGVLDVRSLARQYAHAAVNTLFQIAVKGKNESARVAASVALLDRGFGKPDQAVEVIRRSIVEYSDADLLRLIAERDDGKLIEGTAPTPPPPSTSSSTPPLASAYPGDTPETG